MNISIPPELEKFVHSKISRGMYQSASEVLLEALYLLVERDELRQRKLDTLEQEIQLGIDEAKNDKFISPEESKKQMADFKQQFLNKLK